MGGPDLLVLLEQRLPSFFSTWRPRKVSTHLSTAKAEENWGICFQLAMLLGSPWTHPSTLEIELQDLFLHTALRAQERRKIGRIWEVSLSLGWRPSLATSHNSPPLGITDVCGTVSHTLFFYSEASANCNTRSSLCGVQNDAPPPKRPGKMSCHIAKKNDSCIWNCCCPSDELQVGGF